VSSGQLKIQSGSGYCIDKGQNDEEMGRRGDVEMWNCGYVEMRRRGNVEKWLPINMEKGAIVSKQ